MTSPAIKQLLEHEAEGGKLRPEVVVYLKPEQIGDPAGCHCGACIFFKQGTSECMLTSPPKCDAAHGVCALFLGRSKESAVIFRPDAQPLHAITKEEAGYVTEAPTKCETCEYYSGNGGETGSCEAVGGTIYRDGCCNKWEAGDEQGDHEG
jgi:hypothetical protein